MINRLGTSKTRDKNEKYSNIRKEPFWYLNNELRRI